MYEERGVPHNINIIFKSRERSHFHNGMHRKLRELGLVRFHPLLFSFPPSPLSPLPILYRGNSLPASPIRRKGRKKKRVATPSQNVLPSRLMDEIPLLSLSFFRSELDTKPEVFHSILGLLKLFFPVKIFARSVSLIPCTDIDAPYVGALYRCSALIDANFASLVAASAVSHVRIPNLFHAFFPILFPRLVLHCINLPKLIFRPTNLVNDKREAKYTIFGDSESNFFSSHERRHVSDIGFIHSQLRSIPYCYIL